MNLLLDPIYAFVFLGLFSPGPNVILLTASGAKYGFTRTLPHLMGVVVGVGIIAGLTAFGLGALLNAVPSVTFALRVVAALWIIWMAWGLWNSEASQNSQNDTPMTFIEAVLFQWVNPKIWAVALTGITVYPGGLSPVGEALRLASAFSGINFFVCIFWTLAGTLLTYLLTSPRAWRIFMRVMALALVAFSLMLFL